MPWHIDSIIGVVPVGSLAWLIVSTSEAWAIRLERTPAITFGCEISQQASLSRQGVNNAPCCDSLSLCKQKKLHSQTISLHMASASHCLSAGCDSTTWRNWRDSGQTRPCKMFWSFFVKNDWSRTLKRIWIRFKPRQFFALFCISNVVFWAAIITNLDPNTHTQIKQTDQCLGGATSAAFCCFRSFLVFLPLLWGWRFTLSWWSSSFVLCSWWADSAARVRHRFNLWCSFLSSKRFAYGQAAILQQGVHLGDQLDYIIGSQSKFGQGATIPCIVHLRANNTRLTNLLRCTSYNPHWHFGRRFLSSAGSLRSLGALPPSCHIALHARCRWSHRTVVWNLAWRRIVNRCATSSRVL